VEDRQAIEQFLLTGTEEAFCDLFLLVYPKVRRYFLLRGADAMTAEDLAQNVMLVVHRKAGDLRERDLFHGWVFKVAKHELSRYWRRQAGSGTVEFEPLSGELAARLTAEPDVADDSRLVGWLSGLEAAEREIVILRFVEGLSYEELAVALALPLGTVKWRLFNAKRKLARAIRADSRLPSGERQFRGFL